MLKFYLTLLMACVLTVIIEFPIQLIGFKGVHKKFKIPIFILTNVVTNLSLNLLLPILYLIPFFQGRLLYAVLLYTLDETVVVLAEAAIYKNFFKEKLTKALLVSFIANAASFLIGLIIF